MATFEVTVGDAVYDVDAPDEQTAWAWANQVHQQAPKKMPWGKVASEAAFNAIPSTAALVGNIASAISHPIDTAKTVLDVAAGGMANAFQAVSPALFKYLDQLSPSGSTEEAQAKADAVGKFYADRYGSVEGFKKALAKDPAGVAADAATLLSGGAGIATVAGAPTTAGKLMQASRAVDPLLRSVRAAEALAKPTGKAISEVIGGLGTHTGGEAIRQMAGAGFEGGAKARTAADAMRGNLKLTDMLDQAQTALANIRKARSAEYTSGMQGVKADTTVLNFNDVDSAIQSALNVKQFKGRSISPTTGKVQNDIVALVDDWKTLNPADFHTAEGLDALKQAIGDIRDSTEFGSPSRKVADTVYNAVKNEVAKQAPEYTQVMAKYAEASDLISELQRHVLGKEKGSPITAANKLQKLLKSSDSVGDMKLTLLKELEANGAPNLSAGLSGLALQGLVPSSLLGKGGMGLGTMAVLAHNPAFAVPFAAVQSPRLMGETALKVGQGAGLFGKGVNMGRSATSGLFGQVPYDLYLAQMDRLNKASEEQQ